MLRFLAIKHLAVIDAVKIEFGSGLNVLTGETGAGKSILVEAVALLLGGRASGDLVRTGEETATIEAIFEGEEGELLVRREITPQGRSRAFVNGTLATAGALKDLSAGVIELHGQHEHQTLLDPSSHLAVLDAVGGLDVLAGRTGEAFGTFRRASDALAAARRTAADREARRELAAFQLAELERAQLAGGKEDEELAVTRQVLANAERVARLCGEAYAALHESDGAVLPALAGVWRKVAELGSLDQRFEPYLQARLSIKSELEDLARFLSRYADGIDASPDRLHAVEERLAILERLKRKYGPTLPDVIAKRDALRRDMDEMAHAGEHVTHLEADRQMAVTTYLQAARALSVARRIAASVFATELERGLAELAMSGARFEVRFAPESESEEEWSPAGIDRAQFHLSANPGEELRPLARVASGGELSRIMLAIRTLMAGSRRPLGVSSALPGDVETAEDVSRQDEGRSASSRVDRHPGLIFDEIDAGIGGRAADVVGRKLRDLGASFQVLCITHLPQIAAYASHHFVVSKHDEAGRSHTTVRRLDDRARVEEIARMLGGAILTDGIRASAAELLSRRGESKPKGESETAKAKPGPGRRLR